jgi:hypothetical protein
MSQQLDRQRLEHAFQGRPDLIGAIQHAASMTCLPASTLIYRKRIPNTICLAYSTIRRILFLVSITETNSSFVAAPNWIELFNEITLYVSEIRTSSPSEPASKKRKIEETGLPINTISNGTIGTNRNGAAVTAVDDNEPVMLRVKDISLVIPQRKKYTLEFTASHIRARHPDTNEAITGISYAWKDISQSHPPSVAGNSS